jgi:hypothetical protein
MLNEMPGAISYLTEQLGSSFSQSLGVYRGAEIPPGALFALDAESTDSAFVNTLLVLPGERNTMSPPVDSLVRNLEDAGYRNVRAKTVDWRGRAILVTQFDSNFDHDGTVTSVSTSHAALTLDSRSFMVILTSSARDADGLSDVVLQVAESIRDRATP